AVAAASVGPAFELIEAFNDRDRTRVRAVIADDFVLVDHRPARLGVIEGADAYVEFLAAYWDLAPDSQVAIVCSLAHARYGSAGLARPFGTLRDGGAFESPHASVSIVANGRITRIEMFEPEHVDAALARFAELRPDPLRIPPNAATRAYDRMREAAEAQAWDALRALCAPELDYDARRRGLRTRGDLEMYLGSMQYLVSHRARRASTLLATAGDRLALYRNRWTGADDPTAYEVETLTVSEVDAEGRIVARIIFDPDDRRAASAEMLERFASSDAARCIPAGLFPALRAVNARDLDWLRAVLPADFVHNDQRRTGGGRLQNADRYIASQAAEFELTSEMTVEFLYVVAAEKHGLLAMTHTFGILTDGGEFELVYILLALFRDDGVVGVEF